MENRGAYAFERSDASVLETTTVLNSILRSHGYDRGTITGLAIGSFVDNELRNLKADADLHLLALKKALLYATPVITLENSGILLTSQVRTPAIQLVQGKAKEAALVIGDKFRLIGLAFPIKLVNHLSMDVFPWKHFKKLPLNYIPTPVDLSSLKEVETRTINSHRLFLIDPKHYEDSGLFNKINRIIAAKLSEPIAVVLALSERVVEQTLPTISRMDAFNNNPLINKLNAVLRRYIDPTYTMSFYETLQMTANWLLYDQIRLLGGDSAEVIRQLEFLRYVKDQHLKVQQNIRDIAQQRLLATRAEKITRDRYPYFFDYTDRRAVFTKFNRFSIDRLPNREQAEVKTLLEKELAAQHALLSNKCEHLQYSKTSGVDREYYDKIEPYIDLLSLDADQMYLCKLCAFPLICIHEVDLYQALQTISEIGDSDQIYWVQQRIVNQYKVTNQRRTGEEDTEVSFTYYCKFCGGELGKSNDVIQSSIRTSEQSSVVLSAESTEMSIFSGISSTVHNHMNQSIVPMTRKAITKLLFDESRREIMSYVARATKNERDNMDLLVRYLSIVFALAGLISINIHKLKSPESILVNGTRSSKRQPTGGAQLKDELIAALRIVQQNLALKRIGVTDDRIKAMLIEAFKYMNRIFANEAVELRTSSPRDTMELAITNSPLTQYAAFLYKRETKTDAPLVASGVNLDILFPKGRSDRPPTTHALLTNIFRPTKAENTDIGRYIVESYQPLIDLATEEPRVGKYLSKITPEPSAFIRDYESRQRMQLQTKRRVPTRYLPVENSREYDFTLDAYQIAYCLGDTVRVHRWKVTRVNNKLIYTCTYCGLNIEKASKNNNAVIDNKLNDQMMMEAFFELYTLSCPIRDAHVFEDDSCVQCSATKEQLSTMDPTYYKKYSATFVKHRSDIAAILIKDATSIVTYPTQLGCISVAVDPPSSVDDMKMESLMTSLSKLFGHKNLNRLRSTFEVVESYVRLLYSHYSFVYNLSADTKSHPDAAFFKFVKRNFTANGKPKDFTLRRHFIAT